MAVFVFDIKVIHLKKNKNMLKNYVKLIVAIVFVSNVMAQNIPSYVPKDGLVGWWPFNGNANDESGNGNDGTVNGATLTVDRNGKVNSAYNFEGLNNYIDLLSLNSSKIDGDFTISSWIKIKSFSSLYPQIINGENNYVAIHLGGTGYLNQLEMFKKLIFYYSPGPNHTKSNNELNLNTYYYITSIRKADSISLYINGLKQNASNFNNSKLATGKHIRIGSYSVSVNSDYNRGDFDGQIDDICIFNRALTEQEIKQLYEGCPKEIATSSNFSSVIYTTNAPLNLTATPSGGTFSGEAVTNNAFNPSKAKLGKNHVKYTFKNSTGCADSTNFTMILVDTLGNKCSTYDTLKIKVQLTTGIKAGQIAAINVYPNPTSDVIIIEASDVAALNGYTYKMVDLQGKQVYKELVTKSKTEISLKSIGAKGVYILHVVDAQGVSIENKKIVLE